MTKRIFRSIVIVATLVLFVCFGVTLGVLSGPRRPMVASIFRVMTSSASSPIMPEIPHITITSFLSSILCMCWHQLCIL